MKEVFAMGGYAIYVWTSYGIVAFVLLGNVLLAKMHRKRIEKELQQLTEED